MRRPLAETEIIRLIFEEDGSLARLVSRISVELNPVFQIILFVR